MLTSLVSHPFSSLNLLRWKTTVEVIERFYGNVDDYWRLRKYDDQVYMRLLKLL